MLELSGTSSVTQPRSLRSLALTLLFTALGFLVMGYHPGMEDDGVYLAGIKADLNPLLFPHNADFFRLQLRFSIFDSAIAESARLSHIPLAWTVLIWQLVSLFVILWAARRIAAQLFSETHAQWAGVAMLAAMFTLPVAGTALNIADQHLHPRNIATALIVLAVSRILDRKAPGSLRTGLPPWGGRSWQAVPLLLLALAFHPLMGAMGLSFCCVLSLTLFKPLNEQIRAWRSRRFDRLATPALVAIPFAWLFDPPTPTWLEAIHSRHWFRLYEWTWYEWLGAIAPLALFWLVSLVARKSSEWMLAQFTTAILIYGICQQIIAMILLAPQSPITLSALEPMRYLHLVYIFMALMGGCYLGRYILKGQAWRWAVFLLVVNVPMFYVQRQVFASSTHLELPGMAPSNDWLQAFDWIKHNTPTDAYFALDPRYLAASGEDHHGFRALAERSALADSMKDTSVVTKVPQLGPVWKDQTQAQAGWSHFQLADFERLKARFGVDWVLVSFPQSAPLDCRWHNDTLTVCQIPW
jgi:hypothetical protein